MTHHTSLSWQQACPYISRVTLLQTQAGAILTKMACYIIVALHSADVVVALRKVIFVWSAGAGLDLPVVDVRLWELLPLCLTIAASFATVVEVGYVPSIWHLIVHPACLMLCPNKLYIHVNQVEGELHATPCVSKACTITT